MNLNFVIGTAAELIKIYPLVALGIKQDYGVRILTTGQSGENFMMQYRDFDLPPQILSPLIKDAQDLDRAGSALRWFTRVGMLAQPTFRRKLLITGQDFVIVHGDTLSTLLGAWHGRRVKLPVVHIEAGLRSSKLFNPFPEEINRRLVSKIATYHMAPDSTAEENLRRAGVKGKIVNTHGNTLLDAVNSSGGAKAASVPTKPYALANLHRFENLNSNERWHKIVDTVETAAKRTHVIFIAHPQTRHKLDGDTAAKKRFEAAGVEVRDRVPFSSFMALLKGAEFLLSDGGSNQEECSYLGKPCLLMRESTERVEGLDGCCVLSRFQDDLIAKFLNEPKAYQRPPDATGESPSHLILSALSSR